MDFLTGRMVILAQGPGSEKRFWKESYKVRWLVPERGLDSKSESCSERLGR